MKSRKVLEYAISCGILLLLFLVLYLRVSYYLNDKDQREDDSLIREVAGIDEPGSDTGESDIKEGIKENSKNDIDPLLLRKIDFKALQEENPDIIGWIYIPGTNVDYPILQSGEEKREDYYLRRNYKGESKSAGSIFIRKETNKSFMDPLSVVYGHRMKNKTMFGEIHKYKDEAFFKEYPYAYIYLPNDSYRLRLFSSVTRNATSLLHEMDTSQNTDEILGYVKEKSDIYFNPGNISKKPIVALSTCDNNNKRFVVFSFVEMGVRRA